MALLNESPSFAHRGNRNRTASRAAQSRTVYLVSSYGIAGAVATNSEPTSIPSAGVLLPSPHPISAQTKPSAPWRSPSAARLLRWCARHGTPAHPVTSALTHLYRPATLPVRLAPPPWPSVSLSSDDVMDSPTGLLFVAGYPGPLSAQALLTGAR
jgi:hypothetical protein